MAVKDLQETIGALASMVRQIEAHRWIWQLADQHGVVATSAHGYDRLIRCSRGLEQFRAELPAAEISAGVMISQARRWGGGMA